jgi:hypothetical protein
VIPRVVFGWLWAALAVQMPPQVSADGEATTKRSEGYTAAETRLDCARKLNAQCYELGYDRVNEPCYHELDCTSERDEDGATLTTCTVGCDGECSERDESTQPPP